MIQKIKTARGLSSAWFRRVRSPWIVATVLAVVFVACAPTKQPPPAPTLTHDPSPPVTINGMDLHDGMVARHGDVHLYGTQYGCGFRWLDASTPWCGFGVSSAPSLDGPWSPPTLLFDPAAWQDRCRYDGCFNPRMVRRADGAYVLWFNAPGDYRKNGWNAYYSMTCDGPEGPCHDERKPDLWVCGGNGDASVVPMDIEIVAAGADLWLFCTQPDQTLGQEKLDGSGTSGTGEGSSTLAGAHDVEAPGVYRDNGADTWVMTFSDPNCGYCGGTGTGYATAPDISGSWTYRGKLSEHSCSGQPRTVDIVDTHPYQHIDQWNNGDPNETTANTVLAPLAGMECP
jgi:hypothetical protein